MAEMMEYNKSPMPPAKREGPVGERNSDRALGGDDRGNWVYPPLAASGHVEIELPSLPGSPKPTESLHVRNFGPHVVGKIESSMNRARAGYLRSGPQHGPAEVLGHYVATARGAKLLDEGTLDYMTRLSKEFAAAKGEDRQTYFERMVRPFLISLTPSGNGAARKAIGNPFPNSKMPPART